MKANNIWRFATILLLSLTAISVCAQYFGGCWDLPVIQREENEKVFSTYEMMPSFPSGDRALIEFLRNNIRCPEGVKKARLHGKVMVSFIVEKDGSVENVRTVSSYLKNKRGVRSRNWDLEKLCEEEALRVFKLMPKWIPGGNFAVRYAMKYYFSLTFNDSRERICELLDMEEVWDEESLAKYAGAFTPWYNWKANQRGPAVTDEMKMTYRKPEGFSQVDLAESFLGYPMWKYRSMLSEEIIGPFLRSDDGQVISFFQFAPIFSEKFMERVNRNKNASRRTLTRILERHHRRKLRRDSITVLSTEEARSKWNADSAFTFTLHLSPEYYYEKDFKHLKVLLIQRKGRGYACIYSFYTDKAKENFDEYWRRIEKTLWFKDSDSAKENFNEFLQRIEQALGGEE